AMLLAVIPTSSHPSLPASSRASRSLALTGTLLRSILRYSHWGILNLHGRSSARPDRCGPRRRGSRVRSRDRPYLTAAFVMEVSDAGLATGWQGGGWQPRVAATSPTSKSR